MNVIIDKEYYIESLLADKVAESRSLDYKQTIPGNSQKDKVDFL